MRPVLATRTSPLLIISRNTTRHYAKEACMAYKRALYIPAKRPMSVTRIALSSFVSDKNILVTDIGLFAGMYRALFVSVKNSS